MILAATKKTLQTLHQACCPVNVSLDHKLFSLQLTHSQTTVAIALQDLVQTGRLRTDQTQSFAAQVLSAVQSMVQQEAQQQSAKALDFQISNDKEQATSPSTGSKQAIWPTPRGAYLWGTIGSGKTMLLDLFCTSFSDSDRQKLGLCRLHFHEFMLSIHRRLHFLQQSAPRIQGKSQHGLPVYR